MTRLEKVKAKVATLQGASVMKSDNSIAWFNFYTLIANDVALDFICPDGKRHFYRSAIKEWSTYKLTPEALQEALLAALEIEFEEMERAWRRAAGASILEEA